MFVTHENVFGWPFCNADTAQIKRKKDETIKSNGSVSEIASLNSLLSKKLQHWTQVKNLPKHKTSITLVRKAVSEWEVKMEIFPVKCMSTTCMYQFNKSSKFRWELNKENTLHLTSLFVNKTGGQPSVLCSVTVRGLLLPAFLDTP